MNRPRVRLLVLITLFMLATFGQTNYADTIRIAAAISMKDTLESIQPLLETATGDKLELSFDASGQIASQIRGGAPIDVFISASARIADELLTSKHVDPASRRIVCGNSLVLVVPGGTRDAPDSFAALANPKFTRIAVGEPKSVPAGEYAMQALRFLKIESAVTDRLVYGANVRQVLSYVERGEVSAGIVYRTDALLVGEKVRVAAVADPAWHAPIEYIGVAIAASKHPEAAGRFLDYLQTPAAREAMTSRGFTVPSTQPTTRPSTQPAE